MASRNTGLRVIQKHSVLQYLRTSEGECTVLDSQPIKIYRGTWEELMSHRNEIAPNAVLEVKVYAPEAAPQADQENQALINLLQSWRAEDATDDPEELARRDVETNELMSSLQANRLALRGSEA